MKRFALLTLLCVLASVLRAAAPPAAPSSAEVARLVRQLGGDDFDTREAATRALARAGRPALAPLREAASSDDPEVRRRASRLVAALEDRLAFDFGGKELLGWRGLDGCWSLRDGALVGATPRGGLQHNTFLCSKREYSDFQLKFRVKVGGDGWAGNSGVQIRSRIVDDKRFTVRGPQYDMGEDYWGGLYGELDGGPIRQPKATRLAREGRFNDYLIRCVGKRVTIKLNGRVTVDDEIDGLPASGIIAWQLHGGRPMTVTFEDVRFEELSAK